MANIVIKKNFVDGDKLFSQQLNNNFETIEKGINDGNKIVWQDGTEVKFKRYVTNDIDSLPILDGSIIYDTEKGRHYIDYQGKRVQVGSAGKEVLVQEEQPTEEDNKIWIDSDTVNTMGTEVVNSLEGNKKNMSPSVYAINTFLTPKSIPIVLEDFIKEGDVEVIRSGNVVVVEVSDLVFKEDRVEWNTVFAYGLPKPFETKNSIWKKGCLLNNEGVIGINNDGNLIISERTGTQSASSIYNGQFIYMTKD